MFSSGQEIRNLKRASVHSLDAFEMSQPVRYFFLSILFPIIESSPSIVINIFKRRLDITVDVAITLQWNDIIRAKLVDFRN